MLIIYYRLKLTKHIALHHMPQLAVKKKSPICLSAPNLPFSKSSYLFLLDIHLFHHFLLHSLSFILFSILLSPLLRPLLIPVCYPSSPCHQRSLTTDSLLPFLLPNPYTTSRYWLHAEFRGLQLPTSPIAFPAASPLWFLLIKRHQCDCTLGCGSVIEQHLLLFR